MQHSNRNLDTQILKCTMHGIASLVFNLRAIYNEKTVYGISVKSDTKISKEFWRLRFSYFFHFQELLKASDQAGSVDLSNFMKLWQQFKSTVNEDGDDTEEEIKQAFKDYDRDGDGYITKDEMMNVRISF